MISWDFLYSQRSGCGGPPSQCLLKSSCFSFWVKKVWKQPKRDPQKALSHLVLSVTMCSLLVLQTLWLSLLVPIIQGQSLPPGPPTEQETKGALNCCEFLGARSATSDPQSPHLDAIPASPALTLHHTTWNYSHLCMSHLPYSSQCSA